MYLKNKYFAYTSTDDKIFEKEHKQKCLYFPYNKDNIKLYTI